MTKLLVRKDDLEAAHRIGALAGCVARLVGSVIRKR